MLCSVAKRGVTRVIAAHPVWNLRAKTPTTKMSNNNLLLGLYREMLRGEAGLSSVPISCLAADSCKAAKRTR